MKRAWMKSWLFASAAAAFVLIALSSLGYLVQPLNAKSAKELTLAGIQPGKDSLSKVQARLKRGFNGTERGKQPEFHSALWLDVCAQVAMTAEVDEGGLIQSVAVFEAPWIPGDCFDSGSRPALYTRWSTGTGLRLFHNKDRVIGLYGIPSSIKLVQSSGEDFEQLVYLWKPNRSAGPIRMVINCSKKNGSVKHIELSASGSRVASGT